MDDIFDVDTTDIESDLALDEDAWIAKMLG